MKDLINEAASRIKGVVTRTPVIPSSTLSRLFGFKVWLKLENLQKTGSFKVRGAFNKVSSLSVADKARGVVAASSGNHAQGVAWASSLLGVRSLIIMPENTPIVKFVATRGYGAEVIFHGDNFFEAYQFAIGYARDRGLAFIPPFEDDLVIAGQGTIGLEILEDLPDADTIVVPVGGGGLISGIASAVKSARPSITVIGVEAGASSSCIESLKQGRPVEVRGGPTIADGIAVKRVGDKTFALIRRFVDMVVDAGEDSIARAILQLLERKKLMVEGAGAVTIAAAMEGKLPRSTKKAVFVLSGGNIDVTMLDRVIRLGLLREGRIIKLATVIRDIPGTLAGLTALIAGLQANILHVIHQREAVEVPVDSIRLEIILEVEGFEHSERILKALKENGYELEER
ncbi:MAG: threonine ammonia-lyase [Deltaproteobacteria bacterium GWA2_54_12]|nr:MAG: threonine ammonia-lyase [Deltaproteobacteria bacterium GWA2_54_12]